MRIRERVSVLLDVISAWIVSLISGLHISFEEGDAAQDARNRKYQGSPQAGVPRLDTSDAPRRADSKGSHISGPIVIDHLGDLEFYHRLEKALRGAGLEYIGSHYESPRDRFERVAKAS